jgi:hypothetical protein
MAKLCDLDEEAYQAWVESRPEVVKEIAKRLPPNKLYRLKTTWQRVTMYSINEDGTVTVDITGDYNLIDFSRRVFGINPDDLEECDLPLSNEVLGELCNDEERDALIAVRVAQLHQEGKQHNTDMCPLCRTTQ